MRVSHPLAREIAFWLGVKIVALAALFLLFFGPAQRPTMTAESVATQLLAPAPAARQPGEVSADE